MLARFSGHYRLLIIGSVIAVFLFQYFVVGGRELSRWVQVLEKGESSERVNAAYELAARGSTRGFVLNGLKRALRDDDPEVRAAAVSALAQLDPDEAVAGLVEAFEDRDPAVRIDAAEALERLGTGKANAALEDVQEHTEKKYQRSRLDGWQKEVLKEYEKERGKWRSRGGYAEAF